MPPLVKHRESLLEVEGGGDAGHAHAEQDHGDRDVRLMPTMTVSAPRNRDISAIARSVLEPKESSTSRAATSMMTPCERCADLLDEVVAEPGHLGVVQGGVDGRDQVRSLPQDRDERRPGVHNRSALRVPFDGVAQHSLRLLEPSLRSPMVSILLRSTPIVDERLAIFK